MSSMIQPSHGSGHRQSPGHTDGTLFIKSCFVLLKYRHLRELLVKQRRDDGRFALSHSGLACRRSLLVPQHADVLPKALTQGDGHGTHTAKLKERKPARH